MENNPKASGFTLIEVLASIGIYTVLLLAISTLFLSLYRQQAADIGLLERTHNANVFLDTVGRELRAANRAEDGSFTLMTADGDTLAFYTDFDNDSETERVTYQLTGTNLTKTVVEPGAAKDYAGAGTTRTLCTQVRGAQIFSYYDENYAGAGAALAEPVAFLRIKLVGIAFDLNSAGLSSYPLHFETKIRFRNL